MNPADAEEYTQALGQVVAGGWRQVALGKRLGVPKSLGLSTRQWVEDRLGGYVQLSVAERKPAAAELIADGMSQREAADVLGVSEGTIRNDLGTAQNYADRQETAHEGAQNCAPDEPAPLDAIATLAADERLRTEAKRHIAEPDPNPNEWYTPRWLFDQLGLTFDLDVCAPADERFRTVPARRYYTKTDDGLEASWDGLVWCNPPYDDPAPWVTRWAAHDNGLLLTHFSVKSRRTPELWAAAHGIRMFAAMDFERPNGETHKPYWGIQLAARGRQATDALVKISNEWASPTWEPVA